MRFKLLSALLVLLLSSSAVAVSSTAVAAPSAQGRATVHFPASRLDPLPGDVAPNFSLTDVDGGVHKLSSYLSAGNVVVLEWLSPDCPYTRKFHDNADFMNQTQDVFRDQPVVFLGIDSSAPGQPGSDKRDIRQFIADYDVSSPILLDHSGHVGRAFGVRDTPTMIVIAPDGGIVYRGAPDDSTEFDREPKGKNYVKSAVEAALIGELPKFTETAAYGCSVKYPSARLTADAGTARF